MMPPSDPPAAPIEGSPPRVAFRDAALASGLVNAGQLQACEKHLNLDSEAAPTDAPGRDRQCADLLVQQGTITRFQAEQLLAGRSKLTLGQYEIVDELGRGGMGQVYRGRHGLMGRMVAIKVLPRSKSTPEAEAAFQREIRTLARLDHDNLVRALDAGHDGKVYYLVTELVPGRDLRRCVRARSDAAPSPLDETAAASVITQAAKALAYAHRQGIVHRDIKPSNLLVTPDGRVKVLDLGLAGSVLHADSPRLGRVVGTMDYMAPEQIRDPDAVGPQADIYALGCTLYFAVTGELPFPGGTKREKAQRHLEEQPRPVRQLRPGLDPAFCRVIEGMMQKNPQQRPQSADAVIDLLRAWTPPQPVAMPKRALRLSRNGDGSSHGPQSAAGSSADAAVMDPSQASQQATRGGGSEADETWWSGGPGTAQPLPLSPRDVGRAVGKFGLDLLLATAVGLVVVAVTGATGITLGLAGKRFGAISGGVAFGLVLLGRTLRWSGCGPGRRPPTSAASPPQVTSSPTGRTSGPPAGGKR